jgi:hypothetical protein
MHLKEALAAALNDFIEFERQAKPTPATFLNSFRDGVLGVVFEFLAEQDWEKVADQNREERKHDDT